jgi:hypothetical protein
MEGGEEAEIEDGVEDEDEDVEAEECEGVEAATAGAAIVSSREGLV